MTATGGETTTATDIACAYRRHRDDDRLPITVVTTTDAITTVRRIGSGGWSADTGLG